MKKVLIIVATIAGVIALGNVLIAGAQNGSSALSPQLGSAMMSSYTGTYTGTVPFGRWMHGTYTGTLPFNGSTGQMEQQVLDAVAQKLGMTSTDLLTALHSGQSLTQLAQSKNVSLNDLQAAADAARKSALDALVSQGILTQDQENQILSHLTDMQILGFGLGGGRSFGKGGFGPGNMMPFSNGPRGFFPGGRMPGFRGSTPQPGQNQPQQQSAPSNQG